MVHFFTFTFRLEFSSFNGVYIKSEGVLHEISLELIFIIVVYLATKYSPAQAISIHFTLL